MFPLVQTFLGTLFTWSMTTIGALGCLFNHKRVQKTKLLDCSLGFSAGVMLAASYWSLLSPAAEMAESAGYGNLTFIPLLVGVLLGASFVVLADLFVPMDSLSETLITQKSKVSEIKMTNSEVIEMLEDNNESVIRQRSKDVKNNYQKSLLNESQPIIIGRHLLLMIIAITIHNIPEGLAVGVGFGGVSSARATRLALAIGLQNVPEGLAVALPLRAAGMSKMRSIWYGQLSGLVEIPSGIVGCLLVELAKPLLPYALSFAAGAMIFVVFDDVIPECTKRGNSRLSSVCAMLGFVLMMCMDMGLG